MCRSGHDATCVVTGGILRVRGTPSDLEASEALLQPEGGNTLGSGVNTAGGSVAVLMANLLPQANLGLTVGSQGIYIGEGNIYQACGEDQTGRVHQDGQTVTRVLVLHPGEWPLEAGGQVLAGRLCAGCLMWLQYYGLYMSVLGLPIKHPRVQPLCGLPRITRARPGYATTLPSEGWQPSHGGRQSI